MNEKEELVKNVNTSVSISDFDPVMWESKVNQVRVENVGCALVCLTFLTLCVLGALHCWKKYKEKEDGKYNDRNDGYAVFCSILGGIGLILSFCIISCVGDILYPETTAAKYLIKAFTEQN